MATTKTIAELNRELADKIIDEAKRDLKHPYLGKYIGIANGQLIVVADDLDAVVNRLEQVEPDPKNTFCLEVGPDYDKVYEIWGVR